MTVPMDCAISYTAGSICALTAGKSAVDDPEKKAAALRRGRLFTILVTLPIGAYFYKRWPDWSWMYMIGERSQKRVFGLLGLTGYLASHEAGFRVTSRSISKGKTGRALAGALLSFISFWLVVILGCAHHGIVNTLKQAVKVTGKEHIYAAIGGTHLIHASQERLEKTAAALKEMGVQYLGVSHCTGFKAAAYLAMEFGDRFFQNNAGTRLTLPYKEG